jgi:translation initiation factor 1A
MPVKKKNNKGSKRVRDTTLYLKELGQEYAQIIKIMGNCRFGCLCLDGKERIGKICGRMKKRCKWMKVTIDDIVLVSLRDFDDENVDIILKYDVPQIRKLKKMGLIPSSIGNNKETEDDGSAGIFAEDEEEEKTPFNIEDI